MKKIAIIFLVVVMVVMMAGCQSITEDANIKNTNNAVDAAYQIIENQPAPIDMDYSLERYNLIRRAYWVNGQREKANALPCAIEKPLGYIVLFSLSGATVGSFVVDGKVSSLNSYLFPAYVDVTSDGVSAVATYSATRHRSTASVFNIEIPGIDGGYGSNASGIFFFTIDGKYLEWTGDYLYSDIPFEIDDPVIHYVEG